MEQPLEDRHTSNDRPNEAFSSLAADRAFSQPPIDDFNGLVTDEMPLTPMTIMSAYRHGVFPWGTNARGTINWHHPPYRGLLRLSQVTISRKDRSFIDAAQDNSDLQVTIDRDFAAVIEACASMPRFRKSPSGDNGRRSTGLIPSKNWITSDFIIAYRDLHQLGIAHSIEVYREGRLVAGLYGVDINGVFSGESMFHNESDVAKLAFWTLIKHLRAIGREFIDTQVAVGLAKKWGAQLIPRDEFELLRKQAGDYFKPFSTASRAR